MTAFTGDTGGFLPGRTGADDDALLGVFNGLAIVGIAIMFDRVSRAHGKRLQKHR